MDDHEEDAFDETLNDINNDELDAEDDLDDEEENLADFGFHEEGGLEPETDF